MQYDKIIIASYYYEEIITQLLKMKVDKPIQTMKIQFDNDVILDYSRDYNKLLDFVSGRMLNFGLKIRYNNLDVYKTKNNVIKEIITNNKVIDLGCTDHIDAINAKIANGTWLHSIVSQVSDQCIGVDINKEAVEYVRTLGYKNVICSNIIEDDLEEIMSQEWDYLLMAEVLEHINNPVQFLQRIKEKYKKHIKQYIITVPNAFQAKNFQYVMNNIECINTDHRYWFTPYTISKVLYESGLQVKKIIMCGLEQQGYIKDGSLMMPTIVVLAE